MIIDWKKYEKQDHVLSWVILESMSEIGIKQFGEFNSSKLNVEFKVNGIEIPFENVMNFLNSQLDDIKEQGVKEGIKEGIKEGKQQIIDMINNMSDYEKASG